MNVPKELSKIAGDIEITARHYDKPDGKSKIELRTILSKIYAGSPEFRNNMSFDQMVHKFAQDTFHPEHLIAQKYLSKQ